ncbi:MAG: terminase small subunit [Acidobacteriota bacterium]|nr:terminase small subunit [Acidobacteriota bacterium]
MTPKQHRFVTEYLVDLNGSQTGLRAGYSPRTAPR